MCKKTKNSYDLSKVHLMNHRKVVFSIMTISVLSCAVFYDPKKSPLEKTLFAGLGVFFVPLFCWLAYETVTQLCCRYFDLQSDNRNESICIIYRHTSLWVVSTERCWCGLWSLLWQYSWRVSAFQLFSVGLFFTEKVLPFFADFQLFSHLLCAKQAYRKKLERQYAPSMLSPWWSQATPASFSWYDPQAGVPVHDSNDSAPIIDLWVKISAANLCTDCFARKPAIERNGI